AAALAIFAILSAVVIATYNSRSDSRTFPARDYAIIEAEQNSDQTTSDLAIPDKITSPWRSEAVRRIERVVIGQIEGDTRSENGEIRVIEVIDDVYRIQRLKERLTNSVLSKKAQPELAVGGYKLVFLDHGGQI